MGVEIERKFTVKRLPDDLESYPYHVIEQGYLNVHPAIRVRREDDHFYMTYKGDISSIAKDMNAPIESNTHREDQNQSDPRVAPIGKTEYNMPLDEASYNHLVAKADGNVIRKKRYLIPLNEDAFEETALLTENGLKEALEGGELKIELDIFEATFDGRVLAEVEFPSEEAARLYRPADWFDEDVTGDPRYSNASMSAERFLIKNS